MHVHTFAAIPPVDKYRFSVFNSPTGTYCGGSDIKAEQETYSFGVIPSVSCPGIKLRFQATKKRCGGVFQSQMARGRQS